MKQRKYTLKKIHRVPGVSQRFLNCVTNSNEAAWRYFAENFEAKKDHKVSDADQKFLNCVTIINEATWRFLTASKGFFIKIFGFYRSFIWWP